MSKTLLTRNQGKLSRAHSLSRLGYQTPQQKASGAWEQSLMRRGSFSTPSCEPKTGKSNFPGQGKADSIPMGSDLKRGHTNFPKG